MLVRVTPRPGHHHQYRLQNLDRNRLPAPLESFPVDLFKAYSTCPLVLPSTHLHVHMAARPENAQFLVVPLAIC
jgi:hypothetical protein